MGAPAAPGHGRALLAAPEVSMQSHGRAAPHPPGDDPTETSDPGSEAAPATEPPAGAVPVPAARADADRAGPRTPRRRGRPRSGVAVRAIAAATLELLSQVGYEGLSMEGVAAAAGVGKTTIYRRYRSKAELVVAMMTRLDERGIPRPRIPKDAGTRETLGAMVAATAAVISMPGVLAALNSLHAGPGVDRELVTSVRGRVFEPNIHTLHVQLAHGMSRGDVRPDAPMDAAIDALFGAMIARSMRGEAIDDAWQAQLLDAIWRGIGARESAAAGGAGARRRRSGSRT